jgi:uncharacterized protein YcfL
MIKLMQRILPGAAIVLAAGCASTGSSPQPVESQQPAPQAPAAAPQPSPVAPQPSSATDSRVIVDSALDRTLRILNVSSSTGPEGLLRIQVILRNISDSPKQFSYRVEWFDEDGKLLPLASADLQPWMLLAGETSSVVATAPAVTAKDFGVAFLAAAN